MNCCISMIATFCVMSAVAAAGVPGQINHQGVVRVDGVPFNGTGLFKFAIVDPDAPSNLWSNDGSITGGIGGVPTAAVNLTVTNGVYSVALGDTTLTNMTDVIAPSIFNDDNAVLRIWFDDGVNGEQQLSPDHKLTTSPYTMVAATSPPIGSIIAWHKSLAGTPGLQSEWVECNGQILNDTNSPYDGQSIPDLNNIPSSYSGGGRFLRGGNVSGTSQDASVMYPNDTSDTFANSDGPGPTVSPPLNAHTISTLIAGTTGSTSRPVNMSVVWIMRVK